MSSGSSGKNIVDVDNGKEVSRPSLLVYDIVPVLLDTSNEIMKARFGHVFHPL